MKSNRLFAALMLAGLTGLTGLTAAGAVSAQTVADYVQRDINQETRIRNGLQDGSLNTREAALLERREARVSRLQARDLKDGTLTNAERAQLNRAENSLSRDIHTARTNGVSGNPLSASSQRMQGAVQRDINQQQRIENGVRDGQLTNHEVGSLERGQAHVDTREFQAGRDGRVGAVEASLISHAQNVQSQRIHTRRTNAVPRHG